MGLEDHDSKASLTQQHSLQTPQVLSKPPELSLAPPTRDIYFESGNHILRIDISLIGTITFVFIYPRPLSADSAPTGPDSIASYSVGIIRLKIKPMSWSASPRVKSSYTAFQLTVRPIEARIFGVPASTKALTRRPLSDKRIMKESSLDGQEYQLRFDPLSGCCGVIGSWICVERAKRR
ncbi:hypothetical protein E2P81_ATG01218 [Venturia nashicola]|uniref:Uncharacterized protein n=1 Tax=Venturia nashicola TaxID=86259 RepID=A0A4Z1PDY9_9PEZI|nr:hypothetical protein E6O75_ATG01246 [Venturia nashicola]TLD38675.1 hypothetical protein E2P81_ATG01218 [Venturia nashicola]